MKKTISILTFVLLAVFVTNAQDMGRSIKRGDWRKSLEPNVTYTLEPNFSLIIKEAGTIIHEFSLPDSLVFTSIDLTTDEGITINGVKWATRNVGTPGRFVERPQDLGTLFQWGRVGDGHEKRTSLSYPVNPADTMPEPGNGMVSAPNLDANGQVINTFTAAYGKFIKQDEEPNDWRNPRKNDLWNSGSEASPTKTVNDPCPNGWRMPTKTELASLGEGEWVNIPYHGRRFSDGEGAYLFLPAAGYRSYRNGTFDHVGSIGFYWTSSTNDNNAHYLLIREAAPGIYFDLNSFRAFGFSVRCVAVQ